MLVPTKPVRSAWGLSKLKLHTLCIVPVSLHCVRYYRLLLTRSARSRPTHMCSLPVLCVCGLTCMCAVCEWSTATSHLYSAGIAPISAHCIAFTPSRHPYVAAVSLLNSRNCSVSVWQLPHPCVLRVACIPACLSTQKTHPHQERQAYQYHQHTRQVAIVALHLSFPANLLLLKVEQYISQNAATAIVMAASQQSCSILWS